MLCDGLALRVGFCRGRLCGVGLLCKGGEVEGGWIKMWVCMGLKVDGWVVVLGVVWVGRGPSGRD